MHLNGIVTQTKLMRSNALVILPMLKIKYMRKKNFTLSAGLLLAAITAIVPTTTVSADNNATTNVKIFSEDFGTAASDKDEKIEDHVWTNNQSMFSWTTATADDNVNVRNNNPSDYEGASANGNLYFKGNASFTITGIDTEGYNDIELSFGAFGKNKGDVKGMTVECKADDGQATQVADLAKLGLSEAKKTWSKAKGIKLPQKTKSLTLTFTSKLDLADDGGIRLDDITVTGTKNTTNGISQTRQQPTTIAVSGNTIRYQGKAKKAGVYTLEGEKVVEINSGSSVTISCPRGVYVVKAGKDTVKVVLR